MITLTWYKSFKQNIINKQTINNNLNHIRRTNYENINLLPSNFPCCNSRGMRINTSSIRYLLRRSTTNSCRSIRNIIADKNINLNHKRIMKKFYNTIISYTICIMFLPIAYICLGIKFTAKTLEYMLGAVQKGLSSMIKELVRASEELEKKISLD